MEQRRRRSVMMSSVSVWWCALLFLLICQHTEAQYAKSSYFMDSSSDCHIAGFMLLRTDDVVNVNDRRPGSSSSDILQCTVRFKPDDQRDITDVSFTHFTMSDKDVTLRVDLSGAQAYTLTAGDAQPAKMTSKGGQVIITLTRRFLDDTDYSFGIIVRAYKEDNSVLNSNENPVDVGMVVGIVAGVIVFLIIIAVIVVCCYRKKKQHQARGTDDHKVDLTSSLTPSPSLGLDNAAQNGTSSPHRKKADDYENLPPMKKKQLMSQQKPSDKDTQDSDSDSRESYIMRKYERSPAKTAAMKYENENPRRQPQQNNAPMRRQQEQDVGRKKTDPNQTQGHPPKSPIVSALHSNPRFRASFKAAEEEADERTKKINAAVEDPGNDSDYSLTETWNTTFDTNFDDDPRPPAGTFIKPPSLPPVPMSPVSPRKRENTASIRRAPRPSSSSSEIEQLQNGGAEVSMNPEGEGQPLPSEIVAIRVQDPHSPSIKRKADAQHTLRPDRNKGKNTPEQRKKSSDPQRHEPANSDPKPSKPVTSKPKSKKSETPETKSKAGGARSKADDEKSRTSNVAPEYEGRFKKSDSARKSKSKSPRIGRSRSTGTALEDTDSVGQPSTPRGYRAVPNVTADDYEDSDMESNYNPLRRTGSKNSLYASRSSLYGRRRRKNSVGESVYSFAQDDIEYYRPDKDRDSFKERSLSRRDRGFRSLGDLEVDLRDQATRSTQTLRESASQTGKGNASASPGKKTVVKKGKPKSTNSSNTQTAKSRSRNLDTSSSSSGISKPRDRESSATSTSGRSKSRERKNSASSMSGRPKRSKSETEVKEPRGEEGRRPETPRDKSKPKPKPKPKSRQAAASSTGHVSDDDLESIATGMTGPVDQSSMVGGPALPQTMNPAMLGQNPVYANQVYPGYPMGYPPQMAYPQHPYAGQPAVPMHTGAVVQNHTPAAPHPPVPVPAPTPKPAMSKWDMLCKMTDGDSGKGADSYETGSVAGSVFSNPYGAQHFPAGYSSAVSDYAGSERSGHSRSVAGHGRSSRGPGKSSWEALKEMTDQEYEESQYAPSESNV